MKTLSLATLVALAVSAAPVQAGQILYVSNGLCYITGCNEIDKVASNGTVSQFAGNITSFGLATDNQGNLYSSSRGTGQISRFAPDGSSTIVGNDAASNGMAFDSAGNLYTTNYAAGTLREFAVGQYNPGNPNSNLYDAVGDSVIHGGNVNYKDVAFDTAGNMYFSDFPTSAIWKATPTGHPISGSPIISYSTPVTYQTGISGPWGLAFDASGNLFVSAFGANQILKISANGASTSIFASAATTAGLSSVLNHPGGLAFDENGNLFVTNNSTSNTSQILEFTPDGTGSVYASSGLHQSQSLAFGADTSAPEPATWSMILGGACLLLARRKKAKA